MMQEYILHTTETTRTPNTNNSFELPHQQLPNKNISYTQQTQPGHSIQISFWTATPMTSQQEYILLKQTQPGYSIHTTALIYHTNDYPARVYPTHNRHNQDTQYREQLWSATPMTMQQEYIIHTTDTTRTLNTDNSFEWPHHQLPNSPDSQTQNLVPIWIVDIFITCYL